MRTKLAQVGFYYPAPENMKRHEKNSHTRCSRDLNVLWAGSTSAQS